MGHFLGAVKALGATIANAFRKPTTVQYPAEVRPRPERYRTTSFALLHDEHDEELCIGCLQCERICPSQVITIKQAPKRESKVTGKKRGWVEDFTLDMTACIFCELCVQVCPEDAIAMMHTGQAPAFSREDLVLTMAKLYANEKEMVHSWGIGSRLMEMQEDPNAKKPKPAAAAAAAAPATVSAPALAAPASAPAAATEPAKEPALVASASASEGKS